MICQLNELIRCFVDFRSDRLLPFFTQIKFSKRRLHQEFFWGPFCPSGSIFYSSPAAHNIFSGSITFILLLNGIITLNTERCPKVLLKWVSPCITLDAALIVVRGIRRQVDE